MPPLPQVSRSNSQQQVTTRVDTYIHSARAASHLEATVSRRPVTTHADTKPVQVPFFILGGHRFLKHSNHSPVVWFSGADYRCPTAGPQVSVLYNLVVPLRSQALVRCPRGLGSSHSPVGDALVFPSSSDPRGCSAIQLL
ncbi:hypothetical protein NDU88_004874 [Pleurodeles waltl]|uniref:Uncharacterized protein n=1 Tax=Pleurodeles waltl TaxID=8319 RepID=A0AAV7VI90_PLEWA|nr:hypothetical protein NDU88_004874 [Pleurodeles waltl]